MTRTTTWIAAALLCATTSAAAAAAAPSAAHPVPQERQRGEGEDMRDRVVLKNGKEIRGRVFERWLPKELVVAQGGKRVRVPHEQVTEVTTVNDLLRDFFDKRDAVTGNVQHDWILAEWAQSVGLTEMARLQAYLVLTQSPDHQPANQLLGHRKAGDQWLWARGERFMPRDKFAEFTADWGHPLILDSVHFRIRTNAAVEHAIYALYDLERLYLHWFEQHGEALGLREALKLMDVHAWKSEDAFPGVSSVKRPYFVPYPFEDVSYTYFAGLAERPVQLFSVGTQHILYRCLVVAVTLGNRTDRIAAWLELGLGEYMEGLMQGPPGAAKPQASALALTQARTVLEAEELKSLKNLIHQPYPSFLTPNDEVPLLWAQVGTFVTFLMQSEDAALGRNLLAFTRAALGGHVGDSSSLFDDTMGGKVETLTKPWLQWLEKKSGMEAKAGARRLLGANR